MGRNKKLEKRKEAYKKAVEHKMKSAAELVDGYREAYEMTDDKVSSVNRRNRRIVNRKLYLIIGGTVLQTVILVCAVLAVFLPMKKTFSNVINKYFSSSKPDFSVSELSDEFVGSANASAVVYYTDVAQPSNGDYYAEIGIGGVKSRIYYGISDNALINGFCQYSKTSLPGFNKPIMLYGYSSTYFKNAGDLKQGDIITVTTNYGVYKYEVKKTEVISSSSESLPYDLKSDKEQLILCMDYPFDEYKMPTGKTYCVLADKVSGPEIAY